MSIPFDTKTPGDDRPASAAVRHAAPDPLAVAREKLIVALDVPTIDEARHLVEKLGDAVDFYKVGLGLQLAGGDRFARDLKAMNNRVFLDYKYYDIEETIRNAVARAAALDIDFLTVHGTGNILKSAVAGKGSSSLRLFCVTVLTSIDAEDFRAIGYENVDVEKLVIHRAVQAMRLGCDGVIASAKEASLIKRETDSKLMVVAPGIRLFGADSDDQKRRATPTDAIQAGADYLVIGRPIYQATDPVAAAEKIIAEMAAALS